jgi:hypothetical protein
LIARGWKNLVFAVMIRIHPNSQKSPISQRDIQPIALELFDLSMVPVEESHVAVMEVYALLKLLDMENYLPPPCPKEKRANQGKKREETARHSWITIPI